jgi:D-aminoacyl-tRNA deacylase
MRAVIQRVSEASVLVNNQMAGAIQKGLLVLVGIEDADTQEDIDWLSKKITGLRIFNDVDGLMNLSIQDIKGDILLISQFTLFAATKKGNRPSFIQAAKPAIAMSIYHKCIVKLEEDLGKPISKGIFGADMKVHLINDGPVTIIIDTKNKQ